MTGLLITLAIIAGYVWMGGRTAKRYAIEETERLIAEWQSKRLDPSKHVEEWRRDNLGFGIFIGLVWPVYLIGRSISRHMLSTLPPTSIELRDRERRVAEMERRWLDTPPDRIERDGR